MKIKLGKLKTLIKEAMEPSATMSFDDSLARERNLEFGEVEALLPGEALEVLMSNVGPGKAGRKGVYWFIQNSYSYSLDKAGRVWVEPDTPTDSITWHEGQWLDEFQLRDALGIKD